MSKDRDAYDLEPTADRKEVLRLAIDRNLATEGSKAIRKPGFYLEDAGQQAYRDLNNAGLIIGSTLTGRGYRAGQDWGLIK